MSLFRAAATLATRHAGSVGRGGRGLSSISVGSTASASAAVDINAGAVAGASAATPVRTAATRDTATAVLSIRRVWQRSAGSAANAQALCRERLLPPPRPQQRQRWHQQKCRSWRVDRLPARQYAATPLPQTSAVTRAASSKASSAEAEAEQQNNNQQRKQRGGGGGGSAATTSTTAEGSSAGAATASSSPAHTPAPGEEHRHDNVDDDSQSELLRTRNVTTSATPTADVHYEVRGAEPGTMPDSYDQAVGLERVELENPDVFKHNDVIRGPFGTDKDPVLVPSAFESRICGCTGHAEPDDHDLIWIKVEKDKMNKCPICDQVFTIKPVE